jgi:tetratricopeptide (TPR) repeat protein
LALGGCATEGKWWFFDAPGFQRTEEAELGFAEMAKGNYAIAENHFQKALKADPKDVHALLGAGLLYQNVGQTAKAREMYEAVLALKPPDAQQFIMLSNLSTRPIAQVAANNLAMLEGGAAAEGMAPGAPGQPARAAQPLRPMTPGTQAPTIVAPAPARMATQPVMAAGPVAPAMAPPSPRFAEGDANIASRFATLRALRDQGLITPEEFNARRQANVGALVPLTAPPPAAGLDRPVPSTDQIVGRLRAIGRALETRAISVNQHAAERTIILDALMPAAPSVVANPGVPPRGLMEAADAVRRLEQVREAGLLTADEYARERKAVDTAIQPPPPPPPPPMARAAAPEPAKEAKPAGPRAAVHLASYRSQKEAERGWAQIKRAHQELLGPLEHEVTKVELGGKGTFYRLKAGPVADNDAAQELCRKLKGRRQFCEPAFMGAG